MSTQRTTRIDVVIPAHTKDFDVLRHAVRGVLRYITPLRFVYVVAADRFATDDHRVVWIREQSGPRLPGRTDVSERWATHGPAALARAGWVYQQILKLGIPDIIPGLSDAYMLIDADVVWLREQHVDVSETVRFPYTQAFEYHAPYRQAYERLFGAVPHHPFSLTAHQMVYDQALLREMKHRIESRHGVEWWKAYIAAADPSESSAISELDIYGHWVLDNRPDVARHRQLTYLNVPVIPGPVGRAAYARDFDFVAAHAWMRAPRWVRAAQIAASLARDLRAGAKRSGAAPEDRTGRGG